MLPVFKLVMEMMDPKLFDHNVTINFTSTIKEKLIRLDLCKILTKQELKQTNFKN